MVVGWRRADRRPRTNPGGRHEQVHTRNRGGGAAVALGPRRLRSESPPPPPPEISISAGSAVTEGGDATFTITASPAPAADLDVSVTVSQRGNWGATTGRRTVTVPTGGSVTVTVGTDNDTTGEADGSVTATLNSGSGYTVSASARAATVAVSDDDAPRISISAGSVSVTEGGDATFTITASPVPTAPLSVGVTVTQRGDFGASTGRRTVTVPTSGSGTLTVGTSDDNVDEPDGSVTATVNTGSGYNVSASSGATQVDVTDNEPDIVQCQYPGPENNRCLEIGVRYNEDETNPADAYDLFYGGTTTPLPDLVRRSGDLYAQRVIYSFAVGPDGNDPDLERYYYAHDICADEGFDCTWTSYTNSEGYPIATDLVIRCAEGFRCTVNLSSQRHSATSTVRTTTTAAERPPRPLNERVVPQAEGRQLYRVRADNDGNARDAARYAAVFEAVCTGEYGGATCEFFDHYYDDGNAGPDGTPDTDDDVPGTHIGTTLVVTCAPGYTCDLDIAFVAAVPARAGTDGVLGTDDDVAAVPAQYTATFTPTYVEPGEQAAPRPVTARPARASVGSVSITEREVWVDADDDGVVDAGEMQLTTFINGRPIAEKMYRPEPGPHWNLNNPSTRNGDHLPFICEIDHQTGTTIFPNAQGECPLRPTLGRSGGTSPHEYREPGSQFVGTRVQTITSPQIAQPEEPACLTAWRATKPTGDRGTALTNRIRAWSNTYTDHCSDAELDAHDRAQEQWSADYDATFGSEDYDPAKDPTPNNLRQPHEGNEGTYEQQVEQLWERGEPYYQCISEEEWAEQFQGSVDRCQLVIP